MYKNSFIKVACINIEVKVGNPFANAKEIINSLKNTRASINLFPELCISGYCCGDLFFQEMLIKECYQAIDYVVKNNPCEEIIVIGSPLVLTGSLFNCAIVIQKHQILGVIPKMCLPNYREFYEKRWFKQGIDTTEKEIYINGVKYPFGNLVFKDINDKVCFGVEICEDMWCPITPGSYLSLCGANMMLNLSASNEYFKKDKIRSTCVLDNSRRSVLAYVYASCGPSESTSETVFSGHNMVYSCGEKITDELSFSFKTNITYSDVDLGYVNYQRRWATNLHVSLPKDYYYQVVNIEIKDSDYEFEKELNKFPYVPEGFEFEDFQRIANILEYSLLKRLKYTNSKSLVIGISGGLDSTLALLIACRTFDHLKMDRKKVIGVTMPGLGTSDRTKNNALNLMKDLGITVLNKPISEEVTNHFKLIDHDPEIKDVTYENSQARYRTMVLMDLANEYKGIVLGTGDMSELALGWCTYNGDQMSMYGINAGLPKTLVRYMVKSYSIFVYKEEKPILDDIVATPISPELTTNQVTEDTVGKYEINDYILYRYLTCGDTMEKTTWLLEKCFGLSTEDATAYVKKFYHRFFTQQFKRQTLPEGPKVLGLSLSPRSDYKMPSDISRG